jgi:dipeptidyl aminopeptidase/acylaminoacyl peptidase
MNTLRRFFHASSLARCSSRGSPSSLRIGFAAVLIVATQPLTTAQAARPMALVDLLNVPSLSDPQLSPDGRRILYVLARADWKANRRIAQIWRANADGSNATQLTAGADDASSPRWSPDGSTIAFVARRAAPQPQIHLIGNTGGEARQLTRHATGVSSPSWSPDGASIYFIAADAKTDEERAREALKDDVYAFGESHQEHLWRVDVATSTETRLTSGAYSIQAYQLSRDGTQIAVNRAPGPLQEDSASGDVGVMAASGGEIRRLAGPTFREGGAELSPDNSQLLFRAHANEKLEGYYNDRLFVIPAKGGPHRALKLPYQVLDAHWSKDGTAIYIVANLGVHTELFEVNPGSEALRQLTDGQHAIRSWAFHPQTNQHIFAVDEATSPGELWRLSAAGGERARVTRVFDYLARDFKLPRQEKVAWKGADGVTVEGLLFYPLEYVPGRRYPLVEQDHGITFGSTSFGFGRSSDYPQVLAARGYAVLQVNPRGVAGYGDAYLRDMVGHYFNNAHLDVLAGIDHVIAMGVADPDRLIKMGWSAGGTMTNKLITFTDRFKAASSGAGIANFVSLYAQSDVRYYRTPWFGATPWQKNAPIDLYWDHSPLKDISRAKTPTLILVGESDVRVPMAQSVELYRALKSNGVPTRMYVAPREPHGWRELRHQLFKMNVELDWFERYALGREYTWEKAPAEGDGLAPRATSNPWQ